MDRFARATEMVLVRFDDYWRGWQPTKLSRVSFKTVEEEATVKTLIRSGQADMVNQWLSVQGFRELKQTTGIVVREDPSVQLFHLEMNTKRPPLDNKKVRQAIAYAFEYDTAIQQIFEGAIKARGPVPVRVPGWNSKLPVYSRNVAKAKALLAESGVSPAALSIEYGYVVTLPQERQIGLLLKSDLEPLGFKVEIQGEPWARIVERATKAETSPHITAIFDTLKYPHVDSHTYGLYHPSCWGTFRCMSFYENSKVTQLLESARRAVNPAEQMKFYQEAQTLVVEEAPSVYVANPLHRIAYRDYVKGYRYVGLLGFDVAFYDFTIVK
jgi:peptide/nickel transport system substrate-binding protein